MSKIAMLPKTNVEKNNKLTGYNCFSRKQRWMEKSRRIRNPIVQTITWTRETCVVSKITNANKTKKVLLSQFLLRSAIGGMLTFFSSQSLNRFFPLWSALLFSSLCMCVTARFELSPSSFSLSWNEHGPLTWRHTSQSESAALFNIHEARPLVTGTLLGAW